MERSDLQKIEGEIRMVRSSSNGLPRQARIVDATKRWELTLSTTWNRRAPREAPSYSNASGVLVDVLVRRGQTEPEWVRTVLHPSQISDETPEDYKARYSARG